MRFAKVLCALLFMLLGSSGFLFDETDTHTGYHYQQSPVTFEIIKSSLFFYDQGLSETFKIQNSSFFKYNNPCLGFCSSHLENIARQYMRFSNFIDPALDTTKVIFPFHTFL